MNEQPIGSQDAPYVIEEPAGKRFWCACGRTNTQPYCDGSHKGTGMKPVVHEIPAACKVAWCGCRKTGTPPTCDGSHARG